MSDTEGGPSDQPLVESDVQRPEPGERENMEKHLEELKNQGHVFRRPNASLSLDRFRQRYQEILDSIAKKKSAAPEPAPAPAPAPKAAPAPKPKAVEKKKRSVNPERVVAEPKPAAESGGKTGMPMLHGLYYTGLGAAGQAASAFGYNEFTDLGRVALANRPALDPVLDEIAEELGWGDLDVPMPAPVRLALMTGLMAGSTYLAAHPEQGGPAKTAVQVAGTFFSLNLNADAAKRAQARADK